MFVWEDIALEVSSVSNTGWQALLRLDCWSILYVQDGYAVISSRGVRQRE